MTNRSIIYLSSLVVSAFLGACSRPVAHFQPEQRVHYSSPTASVAPLASPVTVTSTVESGTPTITVVEPSETYVHNDTKLAPNKQLTRRVERLNGLLSEAATKKPVASTNAHKMSGLEKLIMKKLNKKISKHIAPNNPKKPMSNGGLLAGGAVLVLGGLLLLLLTSGTGAVIGSIAIAIGLLALIFGLLAS